MKVILLFLLRREEQSLQRWLKGVQLWSLLLMWRNMCHCSVAVERWRKIETSNTVDKYDLRLKQYRLLNYCGCGCKSKNSLRGAHDYTWSKFESINVRVDQVVYRILQQHKVSCSFHPPPFKLFVVDYLSSCLLGSFCSRFQFCETRVSQKPKRDGTERTNNGLLEAMPWKNMRTPPSCASFSLCVSVTLRSGFIPRRTRKAQAQDQSYVGFGTDSTRRSLS